MAVENDDNIADVEVEVIDVSNKEPDIQPGSDLDRKLDELAGVKPSDTQTDNKEQVQGRKTADASGTDKGAQGQKQDASDTGQGNRQSVNPAHTPRAYGKAFKWDTQGNVVLASTGEIIAPIGAGRKAFERMLPVISAAQSEADKYKGMYESAEKANVIAANLRLTPEEYSTGARLIASWKADPKKAVAFLIKEAQDAGVDVSDLGVGGGVGLTREDIKTTVAELIKENLEPFRFIVQDRETQQQDQESKFAANSVIGEFISQYPDAEIHADSIAKVMNSKPGEISLSEAYWMLQAHATKMGLDWQKPLAPQIVAIQNRGTPQNDGQPANRRALPDMNGRGDSGNIVERRPSVMAGTASTSDIVKEAMREQGYNVDLI